MKKLTILIILLLASVSIFAEKERTISGQIHTYKNRYVLQESKTNHCYILLENNMLNKLLPKLESTTVYTITGNISKVEDTQYFFITKFEKNTSDVKNKQDQEETKKKDKKVKESKELTAKEKCGNKEKNKQAKSARGTKKEKEAVKATKKDKKEKGKKENKELTAKEKSGNKEKNKQAKSGKESKKTKKDVKTTKKEKESTKKTKMQD